MGEKFEVNVGNIGNIDCENAGEALETYSEYVKQSKEGHGRACQENVCIVIDGEPDTEHDFNWYDWRIQQQRNVVSNLQNETSKATRILNNLIERQMEGYG